jgi:hypothetical protein
LDLADFGGSSALTSEASLTLPSFSLN